MQSEKITLCPDYGSPWGLWSNAPLSPPHRGEHLTPEHFHLSETLESRLAAWLGSWRENYANVREEESHTWTRGFDKHSWAREGDAISSSIEEEVPGYVVVRDYRSYLASPTR